MKKFIGILQTTVADVYYWLRKTFIYSYIFNSVERHRHLYGKRTGWLIFSAVSIFVIVGLIRLLAAIWIDSSSLICQNPENEDSLLWAIISQFSDPGNLYMSDDGIPAAIALLSAISGIVLLSGFLVSSIINFISKKSAAWRKGLISFNGKFEKLFFREYVVIIGVNEQTATIIKTVLQKPNVRYVLIQTNKDVEEVRMKLNLKLDSKEEKRIVYYHGERTSEEDINTLRLEYANEIYILGEDMHSTGEEDHDAFNMTCLEHVAKYMKNHSKKNKKEVRKRCHVSFEYQSTFMAFKVTHIYRSLNDEIEFLPFNVHEIWAKKVLVDCHAVIPIGKSAEKKIQHYLPLDSYLKNRNDKEHIHIQEKSDVTVHLIVIGMNQMGVALAMQTALLVHLPNFDEKKKPYLRTTITFIDDHAVREGEFLMGRYSALFELCRHRTIVCGSDIFRKDDYRHEGDQCDEYDIMWQHENGDKEEGKWNEWYDPIKMGGRYEYLEDSFMDVQWEFIEGNIASRQIQDYLSVLADDHEHRTCTFAVCFNNPQQSIATALYLPEMVLKRALQILVYQQNTFDMINKIATSEREWKRYEKLKPFGMIEGCYRGGLFDNVFAMFAHLLYIEDPNYWKEFDSDYKNKDEYEKAFNKLCFQAKRLWEELGIVEKLSNIDLADSVGIKLRSLGNNEDEQVKAIKQGLGIDSVAKAEHRRWLTERLTMGFRPLDEEEKNLQQEAEKKDVYKYSKAFYKNKKRAHLDICSNEKLTKWDKKVVNKNTDKAIVEKILQLIKLQQQAYIQDALSKKKNVTLPTSILHDMVCVGDLWIGRHPVTIGQWERFMGCRPKGLEKRNDDEYVVFVSWNEIQDFLAVLRHETGLPFDLPKKDEWLHVLSHNKDVEDMEGKIWQWTKTPHNVFKSNYVFCGRSENVIDIWSDNDNNSYWVPSFKSRDLGFRLVLRYDALPFDLAEKNAYQEKEDDDKVIKDLLSNSLVDIGNEFKILSTPVTQRQWKAVMRNHRKSDQLNPSKNLGDYLPVETVSVNDAKEFIELLNKHDDVQKEGLIFSLPSRKEWELAAKQTCADLKTIWHNGFARSTQIVRRRNKEGKPLLDMCGNVWEWCDSHPEGKGDSVYDMMGGSWRFTEIECLREGTPCKSYWFDDYKADDVGFRIIAKSKKD